MQFGSDICWNGWDFYNINLRLSGATTGELFNCEDGGLRSKTKHLDIKYIFIREMVRQNLIKIQHIPTDEMIADILTKHLGWIKFTKFASVRERSDL